MNKAYKFIVLYFLISSFACFNRSNAQVQLQGTVQTTDVTRPQRIARPEQVQQMDSTQEQSDGSVIGSNGYVHKKTTQEQPQLTAPEQFADKVEISVPPPAPARQRLYSERQQRLQFYPQQSNIAPPFQRQADPNALRRAGLSKDMIRLYQEQAQAEANTVPNLFYGQGLPAVGAPMFNANANHGESHMGVLGAPVDQYGRILRIFSSSDLNRFGIHPGDRIISVNGRPYNPYTVVQECHGLPGTIIPIMILHDEQLINLQVRRMDGRQAYLEGGAGPDGNYAWAAGQSRYW